MHIAQSTLGPYVESWRPGAVTDDDALPVAPVAAMSALLDQPEPVAAAGDPLPPLWHWLYFLHWPAQRDLGADGHPRRGHFLPPIPHRQRMFAGGRCEIFEPLRVGAPAQRISSVSTVATKQGTTGELLFVTVRSEYLQQGRTRVVEQQDIVYRSGRSAGQHPADLDTSPAPASDETWRLPLQPDPPLLFRFSALTANAHRIHYDAPYAQGEEGYPGLVVHGPLLVLAMLELARRNAPSRRVRSVSYRLRRPAFAGEHLLASGTPADGHATLRIATHREQRHATAEVTFA
ncbi:MaoC family dehydratase N-terminal domain-containing protein [Streptomyces luomodiensis]|uniref:MaoC family dehydratase N-terminal domain-containing protein n=1 Tax=Streptomyces luomodiensis TaxID=3026192 RepID=A0ABY9V844_9ACTN|nr:MaoC family dehydratase N-terminal domain-containing protein [Streptomyces sp. SCA4-21]WNF01076.1 MaoC family dehydratase N-terminal domain-containing protein [Streptomyces sp. SCA4-21]